MDIDDSKITDFDAWIALAREVEPLFGPMADEVAFQNALRQAFSEGTAFCIRPDPHEKNTVLKGGVVISKTSNEIAWLAVSQPYRKRGYGRKLIQFAVGKLNPEKSICVQTFDKTVPEGTSARRLYMDLGFTDFKDGGLNPAGFRTAIMRLAASTACR